MCMKCSHVSNEELEKIQRGEWAGRVISFQMLVDNLVKERADNNKSCTHIWLRRQISGPYEGLFQCENCRMIMTLTYG